VKTLRTLYLILANTLVVLAVAILGAQLSIVAYLHHLETSHPYGRLSDVAKRNYAHMLPEDVDDLLNVTNALRFRYAPRVGWREQATQSRFLNVDTDGIRANGATPRHVAAIEGAVWFFGGSTTFGYGVADEETIPAQLEQLLQRNVVNFGVGSFHSAQETLLLMQYLETGYRPSAAIFLDGINESCRNEEHQKEMDLLFAKAQLAYEWDILEIAKPVIYAYRRISGKLQLLMGHPVDPPGEPELNCENHGKKFPLRVIHARILAERAALCHLYQITCRTFVQPFAGVHGRHDDTKKLPAPERALMRGIFDHLEPNWRQADAIFVTGALDNHDRHAFVDDAHYSAAACKLIALAIARNLRADLR
jgi:hypothetical protein